jgi:dolichol-phosphate mannosyltransferase
MPNCLSRLRVPAFWDSFRILHSAFCIPPMPQDLSAHTITFLVTALNEEEHIEATVNTIRASHPERFRDYEILLVNDGSTDSTPAIMDRLAAADPHIRVLHNPKNLGLGGAYKRGIQHARMEHVMWISGDNAETADNIANMTSHTGEAEIVIPVLVDMTGRPWLRQLTSRSFTFIVNTLFNLKVRYYNGAVIHRAELIRSVDIHTNSFAYQAEALINLLRRGHSFVEIPYRSATYDGAFSYAMRPKNLYLVFRALFRLVLEQRLKMKFPKGE